MLNNILLAIGITLMYSTPLIFTALGGVITQRSGVDNLGMEGMMALGAYGAAYIGWATQNPYLGFIAGGLFSMALSLLHAVASVTFRANQTISGIALNFIGPGVALFLCRLTFDGATQSSTVPNKMPIVLNLFSGRLTINLTTVIAIVVMLLMHFMLFKTKWGLRVWACGEHPAAADTLGVNVYRVRYICTMLSGLLAGFGGAAMTLDVVSNFGPVVISGHGYIALAAVIFGNWKPLGAVAACLLFGFAQAMVTMLASYNIPSQILAMIPYALTLIVLVLFVGRSEAPKANGKPYIKGES